MVRKLNRHGSETNNSPLGNYSPSSETTAMPGKLRTRVGSYILFFSHTNGPSQAMGCSLGWQAACLTGNVLDCLPATHGPVAARFFEWGATRDDGSKLSQDGSQDVPPGTPNLPKCRQPVTFKHHFQIIQPLTSICVE